MKSRMALLALFALIPIGLLAGCGGGDDNGGGDTTTSDATTSEDTTSSDTTSSGALSAEEYKTEADKILEPIGVGAGDLGSAVRDSKSPEEFVTNVKDIEDTYQEAIDALNAIEPPAEAVQGHEDLIAALEGLNGSLADIRQVAEDDPTQLQTAAADLQTALPEFISGITKANTELQDAGIDLAGL